ncbi:hypothetical protein PIB30_036213 [Stylosanthes scabra]|uniref:Myosin-2 n=1 Tax=Stylosanthes scabra TaxID=79078 RepID=A0ABU6TD57_9FABA|nr:hypothetical protein [Stylosanthes scabra]
MLLSASPSSVAKSSLEEMLDSLRRREEEEAKPKDMPPALPARPASRARLPPARRSLPNNFTGGDCGEAAPEFLPNGFDCKRKEDELGEKRTRDGCRSKKVKMMMDADSLIKKLCVWCRQPSGQWELGTIQSTSGEEVSVSLSNGNVIKVARSEFVPANPKIFEGVDDLMKLGYLNEPSVLHNIKLRYSQDMIYTKAGRVLIAVNPFKDLQIFGNDHVSAYRQKLTNSPHVFAVAEEAFTEMMRDEANQSIIISGESGSGKTETAKIVMQYLAALGGSNRDIEDKILQTNHVLEAFGNAKTSRNENSSRFGKLMEIHFSTMGKIYGAKVQTFLLEKSRVVQLASSERSYHIFYQLCAGSSFGLKERLNLRAASYYKYLNQSECLMIDGIDDAKKFHQLMKALDIVQICKEDRELIFTVLAAILWLGNISFKVADSENHIEVLDDEAVTSAARLMGCSTQALKAALCNQKIQSEKDTNAKKLILQQAIHTRDKIATFMYENLFNWIVDQVNKSLQVGKKHTGKSINILDINGFESFQKNSFEQFCINYANERLQQHLIRHLFKYEQEDYESDGIEWTRIDFKDNQECLNLFEKKSHSLLSLLDEESNLPKASDLTFANKLKQHLGTNPCFKGERGRAFSVRHYEGEVLYDTNGFLEKNRDTMASDSIQFLASCKCELLPLFSKTFYQSLKCSNSLSTGALDSQEQSVCQKFKGQLFNLMNQLECTTPHFIRSIRPNTKQLPDIYDEGLVLQQLKCSGILEVVRISRAGYPTRMTHQEFCTRYGFLLSETNKSQDPLSTSTDSLELKRKQVLQGTVVLQKYFRGYQARSYFQELKSGVATLQSFVRGEITRRKFGVMMKPSITIYSKNLEEIQAIIQLQSVIRGWLARKDASTPNGFKSYPENAKHRRKPLVKILEVKDISKERVQNLPSPLAQLQRQVDKAEEENAKLREQLKQSERKWAEYEAKMKSMEEACQKQRASLQMSLVAARKSLASDSDNTQSTRNEVLSPRYYGSEDANVGPRTTAANTPIKFSSNFAVSDGGREANGMRERGTNGTLGSLMKEFDQRRQNFDDEIKALNEVKPGNLTTTNSIEEFRKLKLSFEGWKKQYKVRLRETKAKLHEADKSRRTWWGKLIN